MASTQGTVQYVATDLGTLGGPSIGVSDVNNSGQVVGWSDTVAGTTHAYSWTQAGGIVDLGTLGGSWSYADRVNEEGRVVGHSAAADETAHVFSWTAAGGIIELGALGLDPVSDVIHAISAAGQVVGEYDTGPSRSTHAFSWTPAGGLVDLGTLPLSIPYDPPSSWAYAVNDSGQVVGASDTYTDQPETHAFSWTQAGGMVDLGTLGSCCSRAFHVSDSGQVAGYSYTAAGELHAFSWTQAGGIVDLGTLGGSQSEAVAVNDSGQVVGWSHTGGDVAGHAFVWTQAGGMVDLGTLGGTGSVARAVNASGQVVGASNTTAGETHAFSWTPAGGMVDLGTLGGSESTAVAVNDSGQVVGYSTTASGAWRATLWNPANTCGEAYGQGTLRENPSARFELRARYKTGAVAPEGEISYDDPSAGLSFDATDVTGFAIGGGEATMRGDGTANGASVSYVVRVVDGRDSFSIALSNGYSASSQLQAGRIRIRQNC